MFETGIVVAAAAAIASVAVAIIFVALLRNRKRTSEATPLPPWSLSTAMPAAMAGMPRPMAVLRVPSLQCACDSARKIVGRTFDAASAPQLPVPGCNQPDCQCRYERAVNRRRGERRVHDRRDAIRFEEESDRRKNPDRRRESRAWSKTG